MPISATGEAGQGLTLRINPLTRLGRPAPVENAQWSSTNPAVAAIVEPVPADGKSVQVRFVAPGDAQIAITGDADMGAGVETITDTCDITVTLGKATTLGLTADPVVDLP